MKKTLLTVVAMMATCSAVMAQNGIVEVPDAEGHGFMATTMSPNGKYIAGADAMTQGGFMFDRESKQIVTFDPLDITEGVDTDLQIKSISNNGLAVGWNGYASTFDFATKKCTTFGEVDQYLFLGISPSGNYIVGARYDGGNEDGTPCIFNNGTPVDLPEPTDKFLGYASAGASALSVSDDGIISGYFVDDMATRPATMWTPNKDGKSFSVYPISRRYFAPSPESELPYSTFTCDQTTMSPNGKWLVINFEKYVDAWESVVGVARYNLENDSVEFFTPNAEEDERFEATGSEAYGFAVSDEGTIVGFYGGAYGPRVGFMWKKGESTIQTLSTAFPGATRLADYDNGNFNTPCGISADGRYITGFAAVDPADTDDENAESSYVSWILDTEDESATTAVESVAKDNNKVAKVKARYSLDGMRRDGKFKGVNILRMTNGKTVKKIVK